MATNKEVPERIQLLLKEVVDHFDKEDRYVRERQIRLWKKLKYYWAGFQRLWWSEVAHDWRVFDVNFTAEVNQSTDSSFYDKPINIFRAYLESIIAALSITIPSIECIPDDADNALDIDTAKAGDKIADLICKHNDASILWLHALFIMCTEGMVAAHNYTKEDYSFGSYSVPKYEDVEEEHDIQICPNCQSQMADLGLSQQELDEYSPDEDDVESHDLLRNEGPLCPSCLQQVEPQLQKQKLVIPRLIGTTEKPKSRQCIEVYGGLYVKVPNYARFQKDCPYLIFAYETHYSNAIERYPDLRDKFTGQSKIGPGSGGMYDPYERWGRISTQYFGEYPINVCTIRTSWLRPSSFNVLNKQEDVDELKKLYPDGAKVVFANDLFAEAENKCLDDEWTLTRNPLSDYIHYDPLGLLLTSIQEITNDLVSLTVQTIEHGIPQTMADPDVLDFEAYRQSEVSPGSVIPAKAKTGKGLGDGFFSLKTAALSAEVLPFGDKIQELGQVVSGALPSIFGGSQAGAGGKTASGYSMSRNTALQRLQTPWKMLNVWWKEIFGKVIPAYMKDVQQSDDERWVEKDVSGNFVNVFLHKAELEGKIGSIELESSDQLPTSWGQKKDAIMQLLQAGNPEVMSALSSPENINMLAEAIGLDDFIFPGSDDRQKQYEEIHILVNSEPIPDGMGGETSSVQVEQLVDNHQIEADICRRWLVSEAGRLAKTENPDGYKNVLLHMKQHMDTLAAMTPPPMPQAPPKQPIAAKLPQGASNATIQ